MPQLKLSEAYIKDQVYQNVMSPSEGYKYGTIFKDLVRPYKSPSCKRETDFDESAVQWGD